MDLSKAVLYRGLNVNDAALAQQRMLKGIAVESVDYSSVPSVGYTEKRAAADGMHASDVYLGPRGIEMTGHVYADSLAEMFDYLHRLRSVFSPTSAYAQSPGDRGFLPMEFQQPTEYLSDFPTGLIPCYFNVRPTSNVRFTVSRDRQNDSSSPKPRPTATPWGVSLVAKDPRMYVAPRKTQAIDGAANSPNGIKYALANRGDYETPLNIEIAILTPPGADQTVRFNGAGFDMTITLKAKGADNTTAMPPTIYRWFGDDRVLMTEAVNANGTSKNSALVLRMDLVKFAGKNRRPSVPADINPATRPFTVEITVTQTMALAAGSRMFWNEAFA
jgi:hypothetical protein